MDFSDPRISQSNEHNPPASRSYRRRTSRPSHFVDAAPFRAWLCYIIDSTHLPWRAVALIAQVPPTVIYTLLFGRYGQHLSTIRRQDAEALLSITFSRIDEISSTDIDVDLVRPYLFSLMSHKHGISKIASYLNTTMHRAADILDKEVDHCPLVFLYRAQAACQAFELAPVELV